VLISTMLWLIAFQAPEVNVLADYPPRAARVSDHALHGIVRRHDHKRLGSPSLLWLEPRPPTAVRSSREDVIGAHLEGVAGLYGLSARDTETLVIREIDDSGRGAVLVRFDQIIEDAIVYPGGMQMALDDDLWLYGVSGTPAPSAVMATRSTDRGPAVAALGAAWSALTGKTLSASAFVEGVERGGYRTFTTADTQSPVLGEPARVRPVWFHLLDRLVPAWHVELIIAVQGRTDAIGYGQVVGPDGAILFRKNLVDEGGGFTYSVYADQDWPHAPFDGPRGNDGSPHPTGIPDEFVPDFVRQNEITLTHGPISTGDLWLDPTAIVTAGNNVDAYTDRFGDDGYDGDLGDLRGSMTQQGHFGWLFDPMAEPTTDTLGRVAAINLFFLSNWLHDYFYDLGFDEVAGNAQRSNYGRGGIEDDVLRAEAQDQSGFNNASMLTPADGGHPRMQMYLYTGTDPFTDGSLDNTIAAHEWAHYLTNRLIGDSGGLGNRQGRAMGEGWSDFMSLMIMVREEDGLLPGNEDFSGAYPRGTYANYGRYDSTYYFGNRRYPYSTDMAGFNPLSFRHIENGVPLPEGIPVRFGASGSNNAQVHASGEVWCVSLWECWSALINREDLSFEEAKRRMAGYLVTALKLTPVFPTFTEARDALLLAAVLGDPTDFDLFSAAFAKRGMGAGAISPDRFDTSHSGVVESHVPVDHDPALVFISSRLVEDGAGCDGDGVLDAGESGRLEWTFQNRGFGAYPETGVEVTAEGALLPQGVMTTQTEAEILTMTTASIPVIIPFSAEIAELSFTVTGHGGDPLIIRHRGSYDAVPEQSSTDDVESGENAWVVSQGGPLVDEDWAVIETAPFAHAWLGVDVSRPADLRLTSPALIVDEGGLLRIDFRHTYRFENNDWDGSVIEISVDEGPWIDAGPYLTTGYDGRIRADANNPIADRDAFVEDSPAYPDFSDERLSFPSATGSSVRVRFRVGTDTAVGAEGWTIDDIAVSGIDNSPFGRYLPELEICGPCYYTDSGAHAAILQSFGRGEWPAARSISDYVAGFVNNRCP